MKLAPTDSLPSHDWEMEVGTQSHSCSQCQFGYLSLLSGTSSPLLSLRVWDYGISFQRKTSIK